MTVRRVESLLAGHPVFRDFDAATLAELAGCARLKRFEAGATIFREGDPAERVHLLREGDVALELSAPGREPLVIETLHAGEVLGWSWLVPDHRAMSTARALTAVATVSLDATCIRAKCDADPALGYAMFKRWVPHLSARVRAQRMQVLDLFAGRTG